MSDELANAASGGMLDGDIAPLAPFLRSLGRELPPERGGVLLMVADLIEGKNEIGGDSFIEGRRIVIADDRAAKAFQTRNRLYRIGRFVHDKTPALGLKRAIGEATDKFKISERTAYGARAKWKRAFGVNLQWIRKNG